jgi:hypothetical protein
MTDVQAVVSEYMSCLISPDPGFACPLAASIMTADYVYSRADGSRSYAPRNYVGVLQYMPDIQVRQAFGVESDCWLLGGLLVASSVMMPTGWTWYLGPFKLGNVVARCADGTHWQCWTSCEGVLFLLSGPKVSSSGLFTKVAC